MSGHIPTKEVKILCLASGNICAFPGCDRRLVEPGTGTDDPAVLGEMAHIVGEKRRGPRGADEMPLSERNSHTNLVLLCGDHHKLAMVLRRYEAERGQSPRRVVVHKSSRFEPAERDGFEQALSGIDRYDLLALRDTSESRLVRAGRYPPLRGTSFTLGDISYLYTTGYVTSFGGYPHGHVPSPLQVADHVGDTFRANLLREVLLLTKMNWNSANLSALMPITLSFSRVVGDVLREVPPERTPQPQYRYYM